MRTRGMWMLWAALAAGLSAVALAVQWMQGQRTDRDRIAVASVDIGLGMRLTPQMVRMTEWPRGSIPSGAFASQDTLDGRVVTVAVLRGEPLTEARLAPVGARAGLSAVVPPGKRAMTVRVNDVVGVAGFALPGTTVDILVNTQHEGGRRGDSDRAISKIVLERILVLAVAQEADRDASRPKVVNAVTLEVTPDQAEKLDLARSVGSLSLVLRNPADPQDVATRGVTKSALLGTGAAPGAVPAPMAARTPARAPKAVVTKGTRPETTPMALGPALTGSGASAADQTEPGLPPDRAAGRSPEPAGSAREDTVPSSPAAVTADLTTAPTPPPTTTLAVAIEPPSMGGAMASATVPPPDGGREPRAPKRGGQAATSTDTDRPTPRRACVEILAGAIRRTECF